MPIYEYRCEQEGVIIEVQQRITDEPLVSCPTCSGPVKKIPSRSSFQLAGTGWAADGYTKKEKK